MRFGLVDAIRQESATMGPRHVPAVLALPGAEPRRWSIDDASRAARRFLLMFALYVALPATWYAGIASDVSRGLWNWVVLDVLLVVPGVVRGLFALLG
jgi:hypothetical protein